MPRSLAVLAVAAFAAASAAAQPAPRVPSLTPGVFESRGTAAAPRVSLPDIERQPLTGFGPPPRTWIVPAERPPTTAPFAPDPDGLPALTLEPPPAPDVDAPEAHTLRLEAGGGAQYARYGRANVSTAGEAGRFYVDATYDGLDRADRRRYVASDRLRLLAGGQSFARGRMRLDTHLGWDTYDLLGTGGLDRRRRLAYGGTWGLEGVGATPYHARLGYMQSRLSRVEGVEPSSSEGRIDAEGAVALAQERVELDAAGGLAGTENAIGTDVRYASGGAALALGRADGARLTLGARALWFDAAGTVAAGSGQAVGPIVDVSLPVGPVLRLFAVNRPRLEVRSLGALTELNPYVQPSPTVVPDVLVADAQVGVEIARGPFRLRGYGMGLYAPTYLTFVSPGGGGLFTETYVAARALGVGGDVTVGSPDRATASAGLELRQGETDTGDDLALFAPALLRVSAQSPFAGDRGRAGLALYAEAARPDGLGGTAASWGAFSFDASYRFTGPLAVVVRADRLLGTAERWPGFPEAPYAITLGLRLTR